MKCLWEYAAYEDRVERIMKKEISSYADEGQERDAVNLYPDMTYQVFEGFGGAFTEAATYARHQMGDKNKTHFLEACYGKDGLEYTQACMTLDSCDVSLGDYSVVGDGNGQAMGSFSLGRDEKYILLLLRAVEDVKEGALNVVLSSWSPPPFIKTNRERNHGGKLKTEHYAWWAEYVCKYVEKYKKRGVKIMRISIQNEPNTTRMWDSCRYNAAEEKTFLKGFLHPAMMKRRLSDIEVFVWNHNKERALERAGGTIDEEMRDMVSEIAFHRYSGDHFESLDVLHEKYPDKRLVFTEGYVEYSHFTSSDQLENAQMYGHSIAGDLSHGVHTFIDWNVLLNSQGGPNHADNFCNASIMYNVEKDAMERKLSYTYIRHYSQYLVPGNVRIGMNRFTDKLDVAAFRRPDGKLAVVMMNRIGEDMAVYIQVYGEVVPLTVSGDGTGTTLIEMQIKGL